MLPSVPSEGAYTSWLANCLQKYFEALGFSFYHEIQSTVREEKYPFDIYANIQKGNFVKRFGLQVKRPQTSKQGIYWKLDSSQHIQIQKFQWIWYSLPDFTNRTYYRVACFHTLFKDPNFPFISNLYKSNIGFYFRLGSFANKIMACMIGQKLNKDFDWLKSDDIVKEFLFVNQIHTYLDFTDQKAQLFINIKPENNE